MIPEDRREARIEQWQIGASDEIERLRNALQELGDRLAEKDARIAAALALHPRVLTDKGWLPERVSFCAACDQRWPCANVRALTREGM